MQRLRVKFGRGEEIKFISHLDLVRLWERALRRARVPLAQTEGFNPHPRISLAAPLAVGVLSEAELMDIVLERPITPHWFTAALGQQLPAGIKILAVQPVSLTLASLQASVRLAEYSVVLSGDKDRASTEAAISSLLKAESLPWHHHRDTGERHYDLRGLIDDLWLVEWQPMCCTLGMRLRCDSRGSGRPEQVALALGFHGFPHSVVRNHLILES